MDHLTEMAEKFGLTSPVQIAEALERMPRKRLFALYESTLQAVIQDEQVLHSKEPCKEVILASSSLRSDTGCRRWECRYEKIQMLAYYGALYTDKLVIPAPFRKLLASPETGKLFIGDLYFKHSLLRPLFEEGICRFVTDLYCLCENCRKEFRRLTKSYDKAALNLYTEKLGEIEFIYRPCSKGRPWYVEVNGPEHYVEHGSLHLVAAKGQDAPEWAPKKLDIIKGQLGAVLSSSRIRKYRIGDYLFDELSTDAIQNHYRGVQYNAPYVTNSLLEKEFIDQIFPRDPISDGVRTLLGELRHEIPLLTEFPMRTILSIRSKDYESFLLYRKALKKIVQENLNDEKLTVKQAKQVVSDVLGPQLLKLDIDSKAKRQTLIKKSTAKIAAMSLMVAVGAMSGLSPDFLRSIFALAGVSLIGQLGETLASIEKNPTEIRSHDMYFLLRTIQETSAL